MINANPLKTREILFPRIQLTKPPACKERTSSALGCLALLNLNCYATSLILPKTICNYTQASTRTFETPLPAAAAAAAAATTTTTTTKTTTISIVVIVVVLFSMLLLLLRLLLFGHCCSCYGRNNAMEQIFQKSIHRIHKCGGREDRAWSMFSAAWNRGILSCPKTPRSRARPQVHLPGRHFYEFGVLIFKKVLTLKLAEGGGGV